VILLESSNEWNLSPTKEGSLKKEREEQGLKRKRGETSVEKLHVLRKEKKERMKFTSYWERLSKERKKEDRNFLQCKIRCVASSIPTHHLHLHYLLFLDFFLPYPHSLHHSLSTMIICHTNSLEFSFAFTIYKVYHRYLLRVNHHKNISQEEKSDWDDE
jgi:hypothetical protein